MVMKVATIIIIIIVLTEQQTELLQQLLLLKTLALPMTRASCVQRPELWTMRRHHMRTTHRSINTVKRYDDNGNGQKENRMLHTIQKKNSFPFSFCSMNRSQNFVNEQTNQKMCI